MSIVVPAPDMTGMEVKDLNKCKTGHAFEVILKQPGGSAAASPLKALSPNKKRDVSLDDIRGRLLAAEERRKSQQFAVVNQAKSEEEKVLKVKQKKQEADENFVHAVEEHLKAKWELYEENHLSKIRSKVEKFKELNEKPELLREKVKREVEEMCNQLEETLQQKMEQSAKSREEQIKQRKEKIKEKENHAEKVRQNKLIHQDGSGEPAEAVPCK
ncbi:stathmin-1-A-like isoform X1 [Styela clava]